MDSTPKRPGRPKQSATLTPAQRQRAYRARLVLAQDNATLKPATATTAALLAGLTRQLKAVSDPVHADIARDIAARLIKELCERHEIQLTLLASS